MKKTAILKRVICVIAILALALTCFACGEKTPSQGDEPSKSNDEQPNNGETIELEFWLVGTEEDMHYKAIPAVVDQFNADNPGIKVNVVVGGGENDYNKKIALMADSNSLPDFFELGSVRAEGFLEGGVVTEITDYIDQDSEWSSYKVIEGAYDNMYKNQGGEHKVGVAINSSAAGWFFNKTMFEEQGLEIPQTWDELLTAVKKFKEAGITPIAHGASDLWSIWGYFPMYNQYGITELGADIKGGNKTFSETMIGPYNRVKELADAGAYPQNCSAMTYAQALAMFTEGESPIITTGSWEAPNFAAMEDEVVFGWGFTDMPDTNYEQNVGLKGVDWFVYAGSSLKQSDAKLEAGLKFLKYLCSPEANKILLENGFTFPAYEVADMESIEMDAITKSLYEKISDDTQMVDYASSYVDGNINDAMTNTVSSVISGDITPEEAVQQLDDSLKLLQ